MSNKNNHQTKGPWRFLFLALAVCGALMLLDDLVGWILYLMLPDPLLTVGEATSIGIIGGADGPTAVLVAGVSTSVSGFTQWVLPVLMLVIGVFGWLRLKKQDSKKAEE